MPRNVTATSAARNRNRITNKARLKIYRSDRGEGLVIPDDDEELQHLSDLVAGVDVEDANEQHLRDVLYGSQPKNTNGSFIKGEKVVAVAAFIPTPDSTGIVDRYEELYISTRWKDPATFLRFSSTAEETIENGLAGGFTYYMDERDKQWLDKNNEEARGEGTSANVTSATRTSARSVKAKGKEPESIQPIAISEDEFELVMGLFEMVTHTKNEFLHHNLEIGIEFPLFSEYQDTFASPLPINTFAAFVVPQWVPNPEALLRISLTVYPYWRSRRLERNGHRIIPALNGDESDTLNESYICFRRRETKAIRKTRAVQGTLKDKLSRLQLELVYPLELAKLLLTRENAKKDQAQEAQIVWEKRLALVDFKVKYPNLSKKGDEELLVDKEPSRRTSRAVGLKLRAADSTITPKVEIALCPRERSAMIREETEQFMQRRKQADILWEDQVDYSYQPPYVQHATRHFRWIDPQLSLPSGCANNPIQGSRQSVRMRYGRGGVVRLDRRHFQPINSYPTRRRVSALADSDDSMAFQDPEEVEMLHKTEERWRYDLDDYLPFASQDPDEEDRMLVDEYDSKYLIQSMSLFTDQDQQSLYTDASIPIIGPDGRRGMKPFHFNPVMSNPPKHPVHLRTVNSGGAALRTMTAQKMPPPSHVPQRHPSLSAPPPPSASAISTNATAQPLSLEQRVPLVQAHPTTKLGNGTSRAAISMPYVSVVSNGAVPRQADATDQAKDANANGTIAIVKLEHFPQILPSAKTYHAIPVSVQATSIPSTTTSSGPSKQATQQQIAGLNLQQLQSLKSSYANVQNMQGQVLVQGDVNQNVPTTLVNQRLSGTPAGAYLPSSVKMDLKLPTVKALVTRSLQKPVVAQADDEKPEIQSKGGHINPTNNQNQLLSSLQHNPASVSSNSKTPSPRLQTKSAAPKSSPSLQHQQPLGRTQSGY